MECEVVYCGINHVPLSLIGTCGPVAAEAISRERKAAEVVNDSGRGA